MLQKYTEKYLKKVEIGKKRTKIGQLTFILFWESPVAYKFHYIRYHLFRCDRPEKMRKDG